MNFLFYFINIYYTITFKYFFLAFICLFIILFIFYKQIDYFLLTKITYLTNLTTFKYIDVFDIFFSNFKINFLILFFLLSSISPIYIYIDQKLCVALKFNKIIKYICLSVIVLNNIIIYIYINYICVLYFKILLSYQIQINQNNSNFFLGFDLYLANFINF